MGAAFWEFKLSEMLPEVAPILACLGKILGRFLEGSASEDLELTEKRSEVVTALGLACGMGLWEDFGWDLPLGTWSSPRGGSRPALCLGEVIVEGVWLGAASGDFKFSEKRSEVALALGLACGRGF